MRVLTLDQIRPAIDEDAVIDAMRDALIAQSRGECDTPMPMHLDIADPTTNGEVHIKSSYRRGGKYFALKMASTFHGKGNGMILLCDAATGKPLVYLDDAGHLTDVRTAAVAAMTARELRRTDRSIGILGTGIQARLTAFYHQHVLPLQQIFLWGRNPDRAQACAADIRGGFSRVFPRIKVDVLDSPAAVAQATSLIVTCTAARAPLLDASDLQPGTHISAVGSDSPGKQELNPAILRVADLVLADSLLQCEKLGELQHAPEQAARAIEIGKFCEQSHAASSSVADFTGLGIEDLFIAELIYANGNF